MLQLYTNIKNRRKELGLTQTELAEKLGYADKSMIAKIEAGTVDINQSKIIAFAEALNMEPSDLYGWSKEPAYQEGFELGKLSKKYRQLTDEEKLSVDRYIDFLLSSRK